MGRSVKRITGAVLVKIKEISEGGLYLVQSTFFVLDSIILITFSHSTKKYLSRVLKCH